MATQMPEDPAPWDDRSRFRSRSCTENPEEAFKKKPQIRTKYAPRLLRAWTSAGNVKKVQHYEEENGNTAVVNLGSSFALLSKLEVFHRGFVDMPKGTLNRRKRILAEIRGTVLILCQPSSKSVNHYQPAIIVDMDCIGLANIRRKGKRGILIEAPSEDRTTIRFYARDSAARELWLDRLHAASKSFRREDFELVSKIGEGQFGKVFAARERLPGPDGGPGGWGPALAVKELAVREGLDLTAAAAERRVLGAVPPHPFLVGLRAAFWEGRHLYFALELARGGDLFTFMQRVRPTHGRATLYAAEVLLALEHLHAHGVVYRDLKPENVFLRENGHIMLGDLGLAKFLEPGDNGLTSTFCGTESYLAPEVVCGGTYGRAVDLWQLGCFVYELYCGRSPFWRPRHLRQNLHEAIKAGKYKMPQSIPDAAKELIAKLLTVRPEKRLGNRDGALDWRPVRRAAYFAKIKFPLLHGRGVQLAAAERVAQRDAPADALHRVLRLNFEPKVLAEVPQWGQAGKHSARRRRGRRAEWRESAARRLRKEQEEGDRRRRRRAGSRGGGGRRTLVRSVASVRARVAKAGGVHWGGEEWDDGLTQEGGFYDVLEEGPDADPVMTEAEQALMGFVTQRTPDFPPFPAGTPRYLAEEGRGDSRHGGGGGKAAQARGSGKWRRHPPPQQQQRPPPPPAGGGRHRGGAEPQGLPGDGRGRQAGGAESEQVRPAPAVGGEHQTSDAVHQMETARNHPNNNSKMRDVSRSTSRIAWGSG